jgi:hypothetical protein
MKRCFKCGLTKPLGEFYPHKQMRDGHLNKCRECARRDVRQHRQQSERVREYDRERAKLPHRKAARRAIGARWRKENPDAARAQCKLTRAVQAGRVKKMPCEMCGEVRVHGHHRDYSKPLEVIWLCPRHHHKAHGLARATR